MKRIYLMRHSKAGQTNKKLIDDIERTLTKKGEEQAPKVAEVIEKLYAKDLPPELIVTSTAIRARQTATLIKNSLKGGDKIDIKSFAELYLNSERELLGVLQKIDNKINSVLVVSHVPGLQNFAIDYAATGDKTKFRQMRSNFPPGSFVTFNIDSKNWKDIKPKTGDLVDYVNSKKLKDY